MSGNERDNGRTRAAAAAVLGATVLFLPVGKAEAQTAPLPTPPGFEQPSGLEFGGFSFYNRIQTGLNLTDNVRLDPTEEADFERVLAINALARSTWKKHALSATFEYIDKQALDIRDQKSDALSGTISGRYDITDEWSVRAGALVQDSIVGKNDPEQFAGNLNGTTQTNTLEGAINWDNKKYFFNVLSRYQDISNDTAIDVDILSRIQSQDRKESNLTFQLGKHYVWGQAYLLGGPQRVTYSGSEVILPEDRDSEGGRIGIGAEFKHGDWQGIARLIGFAQYFNADTIGSTVDAVGTLQLTYKLDDQWSIAGAAQRSFDETNIQTSGGLFTNVAAVGAVYAPREDVYIKLGPAFRYYEIEGTDYTAKSYSLDGTAAWQVHDRVELMFTGTVSNQLVSDTAFLGNLQYSEAAGMISVVVTF